MLRDFLLNPASWLSFAALALSIANRVTQSRQWSNVNRARIRPMATRLRSFHIVDATEARTRDWGYQPIMHAIVDDASKVSVESCLVLVDPTNLGRILGPHTLLQLSDAEREAATASKSGPVAIAKQMEFVWGFVNDGSLPAEEVEVEQEVAFDDTEWQKWPERHRQRDLKRGEEFYLHPWLMMTLDHIPSVLRMRVTIAYSSDGTRYSERFATQWDPVRNTWTRTE